MLDWTAVGQPRERLASHRVRSTLPGGAYLLASPACLVVPVMTHHDLTTFLRDEMIPLMVQTVAGEGDAPTPSRTENLLIRSQAVQSAPARTNVTGLNLHTSLDSRNTTEPDPKRLNPATRRTAFTPRPR